MIKAYVDVRGPHPVLIMGVTAITLRGATRNITVEEALKLVKGE